MIPQAPPPDAAGEIVRLVPREPTAAMFEAAWNLREVERTTAMQPDWTWLCKSIWQAMYDAATPTDPLRSLSVGEAELAPFADYHGDLPDYDHPLRCVYESGIQYAVELLAKMLQVENWEICDGTEEFDGDLGGTLLNIVLAAMPKNADGDPYYPQELEAALSQSNAAQARGFAKGIEAAAKVLDAKVALLIREEQAFAGEGNSWSNPAVQFGETGATAIRALSQGSGSTDGGLQAECGLHLWKGPCPYCAKEEARQPAPPASGDVGEFVERLRVRAGCEFDDDYPQALSLLNEAATFLDSRKGEVERLREALEGLLEANENDWEGLMSAREKASAALQPEQRG